MKLTLAMLSAVCMWAQSGIEVPAIGAIVDSSGSLRQVQGMAGNFLIGSAIIPGVLSVACSERLCLVKTDSKILSPTGETDAPPGPAIFAVEGEHTIVFFPQPRTFARWHNDTLEALDWQVDGEVVSMRENEIVVRREGNLWIVHPDGSVVDWIATTGPVLLLADGVLFAAGDHLVLRHRDASEQRFELTGAESITAMGLHYAAIRAGDAVYALRTDSGREQLFLLPGSVP